MVKVNDAFKFRLEIDSFLLSLRIAQVALRNAKLVLLVLGTVGCHSFMSVPGPWPVY